MEVGDIVNSVSEMFKTHSLSGKHVLVTAGPTRGGKRLTLSDTSATIAQENRATQSPKQQ